MFDSVEEQVKYVEENMRLLLGKQTDFEVKVQEAHVWSADNETPGKREY